MKKNQDKSKQIKKETRGRKKVWTTEKVNEIGEELLKWFKADENHMFIIEFAVEKDIWKQRFYEWAKENEVFADYLKKAEEIQETRLLRKGVKGGNATAFTIFLLKNLHGYRDKQDIDMKQERIIKVEGEDAKLIKKMLKDVKNNAKSVGKNE